MKATAWRVCIAWLVHGALEVVDPGRPHSHLLVAIAVFVAMTVLGGVVSGTEERSR